jgi:general stress protein 26
MQTATETRETLIDLMEDFSTGMLVTRATNGDLRSRPMQVARLEEDGTLYFAAGSESAKADEIAASPEVNMVFQGGEKYLSLSGPAEMVNDPALIDDLYKPDWKVWFPEGKDDPELRILKLSTRRGEYWDVSGTGRIRFLYEAGKALIRGEEMGDFGKEHHAKVEL